MKHCFPPVFAMLLAVLALPSPSAAQVLAGKARIVSGDVIEIDRRRIRLFGIAAPLPRQTCTAQGAPWACGQNATFALSAIVERQWVHCQSKGSDAKGRVVAICRLAGDNGPDIGAAMVRQGWALADRSQSEIYIADEDRARIARSGIWVGKFKAPWKLTPQRQRPPPPGQ